MGKMSKSKGSGFERTVAKMFSEAFGLNIVRTPNSGGWGQCQTKGDLIADPTETSHFPWFVECKKQESWDLWSFIFSGKGPPIAWWSKVLNQAASERKSPLLVMGQNRKPPIVLYRFLDAVDVGRDNLCTLTINADLCHVSLLKDWLSVMGGDR